MTRHAITPPRWLTHRKARARLLDDMAAWMIGAPEGDWSDRYTVQLERLAAGAVVIAFAAAAVGVALHIGGCI